MFIQKNQWNNSLWKGINLLKLTVVSWFAFFILICDCSLMWSAWPTSSCSWLMTFCRSLMRVSRFLISSAIWLTSSTPFCGLDCIIRPLIPGRYADYKIYLKYKFSLIFQSGYIVSFKHYICERARIMSPLMLILEQFDSY